MRPASPDETLRPQAMNDPIPPKPAPVVDRSKAWVCLLTNLFVCPGVGSILAGRRRGYLELGMALLGAAWMTFVLVRLFTVWIQLLQAPPDAQNYIRSGMGGLTLFMGSWLWSLITSLSILRQSKRTPPVGTSDPSEGK